MISGPFPHFDHSVNHLHSIMLGHPSDATSALLMPSSSSSPHIIDVAEEIRCRVCERKYDGSQHFGIDICRACAAFFRRSVSVKKTFVCRRGTDSCSLNTNTRKTTCQKCRWMRCLNVGLQMDLVVQRKSPDHVKNSCAPQVVKPEYEDFESGSEKSAGEEMDESASPSPPVQISFPSLVRPIPTIANPNLDTTKATLINRVLINYNEFTRQRLEVEMSMPHMLGDSKIFGSTGIPLFKATRKTVSLIYQKQIDLLHNFLSNTFTEYAVCEANEQKRICALFYPVLWEIESCYWTYRNMPVKQENESLLMCTQTTYIDANDVGHWLGETVGQEDSNINHIKQRLENLVRTARRMVLEPMHKLIIKEFEFIMILALNIWAARNHRGNNESEARADAVRLALFNDIHILYHDGLKIDNYACRMGEIMSLLTDVQNADISSIVQDALFADLIAKIQSM